MPRVSLFSLQHSVLVINRSKPKLLFFSPDSTDDVFRGLGIDQST